MAAPRDPIRRVLTIAGSDSGGGAGIQADLKAFAACGVHGMSAVTAITAQNTVGVDLIEPVSPEMILAQVDAVARDIGVDAVKIGMLGTVETIAAVARALDRLAELAELAAHGHEGPAVVLDPVMVSESGSRLLAPDAREALVRELLPRVSVITPNLPEARVLAGHPAPAGAEQDEEAAEAIALARSIHTLGPACVVVTGGHRALAIDVFFDGDQVVEIPGRRHPTGAAHGSGCTHSSVLAARLALGDGPLPAAIEAKRRAALAVRDGLTEIGAGAGPVDVLGLVGTP